MDALLTTISPLSIALLQYKKTVFRDLSISVRQLEATTRVENELDAELLSQLPELISPLSEEESRLIVPGTPYTTEIAGRILVGEHSIASLSILQPVSKKTKFPVLATVVQISAEVALEVPENGEPL